MKIKNILFFVLGFIAILAVSVDVGYAQSFQKNLRYGMINNQDVMQLQKFLTGQGLYTGSASGNYFALTQKAIKAFQVKVGIVPATGNFGSLTRAKVNQLLGLGVSQSSPVGPSTTLVVSASQSNASSVFTSLQTLYSNTDVYSKKDIDTKGTISVLFSDNILSTGNTAIIDDGNYEMTVEHISDTDYSGLQLWDTIEVRGVVVSVIHNSGTSLRIIVDASKVSLVQRATYNPVDFATFSNDPNAYFRKDVVLTGLSDGIFFPKGGSGGTNNYVEIGDPTQRSLPKIEINIDDNGNYSSAVNSLTGGTIFPLKVYGLGYLPQTFTLTNGSTISVPVISAKRIDKCAKGYGDYELNVVNGETKLSDIVSACLSWQTIFSSVDTSDTQNSNNAVSSNIQQAVAVPAMANAHQKTITAVNSICQYDPTIAKLTLYNGTGSYDVSRASVISWTPLGGITFSTDGIPAGNYRVKIPGYTSPGGYCNTYDGDIITLP